MQIAKPKWSWMSKNGMAPEEVSTVKRETKVSKRIWTDLLNSGMA